MRPIATNDGRDAMKSSRASPGPLHAAGRKKGGEPWTSNPQGSQARPRAGRSARPIGGASAASCREIKEVAHRGGFEPPTPRFVVWCSIQLSYRCVFAKNLSSRLALTMTGLGAAGRVVCPGQGAYLLRSGGDCKNLFELFTFAELRGRSGQGATAIFVRPCF